MATIWNLLTVALVASTITIGVYVYTSNVGPRGPKGDQGESFSIDVIQDLTDCADFETISTQYPISDDTKLLIWVIGTDSRSDYTGCPTVYDLHDVDVTEEDLSNHLIIYNGETWYDHGLYTGVAGTSGADGNVILYASSGPTVDGVNGDFFLNTTTNTLYGPKAAGSWPAGTPLTGDAGDTGVNGLTVLNGSGAPSNGTGVDGDIYIDTSSTTLYVPKASGTWPSGVPLINTTDTFPLQSVLSTAFTYLSDSVEQMQFGTTTLLPNNWTFSVLQEFTCVTSGTYQVDVLAEFKCNVFTSHFTPTIYLRLNNTTDIQTNSFDITSSTSRGIGQLHIIRAFTAGDTLGVRVLRGGTTGDEIQVTNSSFTIKRLV
jgi:hypothetical protein